MGNMEAVRLLAENGADATAMSKLWYTALSAPFLNQQNSLDEGRVSKFCEFSSTREELFCILLKVLPEAGFLKTQRSNK